MALECERDQVELLAEEFTDRYRRGERPNVNEFIDRCPERGDEIRQLFEALLVLEQFKSNGDLQSIKLERLGEYKLLREIGRGGMGVVYEAIQEPLNRQVALKVLTSSAFVSPQSLERSRTEARAAARLHHTNIVPIYGVGESAGVHYYAMQFIEGQGLDSILADVKRLRSGESKRTGKVSSSLSHSEPTVYCRGIAKIGLQVAEALSHAHERRILHRDIKPSNIMMDRQGDAWVTDFGLAKADDGDAITQSGDVVGTVRYMAPERFRGNSIPQSDIYGLGVTLYEMLTLQPAFATADRLKLIDDIQKIDPPTPRSVHTQIPRDLETIILKCINKEPRDRYDSANDLAEDLRRFLADQPIQARRSSGLEQAWRWIRRNPALASVAITALLFLIVGLALTYQQWQRAEIKAVEARDQTNRAEKSYQWAYGAIDTMLNDFAQMTHARESDQIRSAQQRMLQNAVKLQDEFRYATPPSDRQQHELASVVARSGAFRRALSDRDGALAAYAKVLELSDKDQSPSMTLARASALKSLAFIKKDDGDIADADAHYRQVIDLMKALNATQHQTNETRYLHIEALLSSADMSQQLGRLADADRLFQEVHERVTDELKSALPDSHRICQLRFLAGQADVLWAAQHFSNRKPAQELECYRRAAHNADAVLASKPSDATFRKLANQSHVGIADALRRAGDMTGAEPEYRIALTHSRWLVDQFPHEADYRAIHARTLNQFSKALDASRSGEALLATEEAARQSWCAVVKRPESPLYRSYLKSCVGSYVTEAKKANDANGLTRLATTFLGGPAWSNGEEAVVAASLLCHAARTVPNDRRETFLNLCLGALQKSVDRGFRDVERLNRTPEFDVVRTRPEFVEIVSQLTSPKK